MGGKWRHPAEVSRPFDRLTPVSYSCSLNISRPALILFELIALFQFYENRSEAEIGSRWRHAAEFISLVGRPTQGGFLCPYLVPV
jgi:hypothetical protein